MATFKCIQDDVVPFPYRVAGEEGRLQVKSSIGWLTVEDYTYCRNGCTYRINPNEEGV